MQSNHSHSQESADGKMPPNMSSVDIHIEKNNSIHDENYTTEKHENEISPFLATKSTFPEHTRFTQNVQGIINLLETTTLTRLEGQNDTTVPYWPELFCHDAVRIIVDEPFTPPSRIECKRHHHFTCRFIRSIFASDTTILPYNTSIGMSNDDANWNGGGFFGNPKHSWGNCLSSSSPLGEFAMTNFQDMDYHAHYSSRQEGYVFDHAIVPWEKRDPIPIFRGDPRVAFTKKGQWWTREDPCPENITGLGPRFVAANFSFHNPHLLNAMVSHQTPYTCNFFCCDVTHGMDLIFRTGIYRNSTTTTPRIPPEQYYTEYQTTVILGGYGAAFRTGRHLAGGQAVVLQDYYAEEWFVKFMRPYEHYIPLSRDLSDLQQVMEWVRDNPDQVKQIAENGNRFYKDYLAFRPTEEHWYELLWRLSLSTHANGSDRLKYGKGRAIWPHPILPLFVNERKINGNGRWEGVNMTMDLIEEDAAINTSSPGLLYLPDQWEGGVPMKKEIYNLEKKYEGWVGV